jgi:hypothetical protein
MEVFTLLRSYGPNRLLWVVGSFQPMPGTRLGLCGCYSLNC